MHKERILFLFLKTGGGHISAARALSRRIEELYGNNAETFLLDPIPPGQAWARTVLEDGYRFASNIFSPSWILLFEISRSKWIRLLENTAMTLLSGNTIAREIKKHSITKVVILHFLLIYPAHHAIKKLDKKIPALIVITDPFSVHSLWFGKPQIPRIVFSDQAIREGVENYNISPKKIYKFPLILRRQFETPLSDNERIEKRRELGFSTEKPLLLFAGGGEGLPKGEKYVKAFLRSSIDAEIAVVCGNNISQKKRIQQLCSRFPHKKVTVYGYIDFMFELMNMADIIIAKGGPATVMEVLILKKPLIVTQYVYGQERGNVDFLLKNGVGYYIDNPKGMVKKTEYLLKNPSRYNRMMRRIEALNIRNGTDPVARFIISFSEDPLHAF
ncbi:MAG: hypothetical protein DRP87_01210 [Spirochaetes bacterium]|nr:MAG: hypothetical protein DRP87_01210 [Spirochaetota bacterium]